MDVCSDCLLLPNPIVSILGGAWSSASSYDRGRAGAVLDAPHIGGGWGAGRLGLLRLHLRRIFGSKSLFGMDQPEKA